VKGGDTATTREKGRENKKQNILGMLPAVVSVAVVGSGISGLMCAQTILRQSPGAKVVVYEWGRGPGGRTARRRVMVNGTSVSFDHAAPFFTAATSSFRDGILKDWHERGIVAPWSGNFASFCAQDIEPSSPQVDTTPRFVGVPTMHSVCRALSDDVIAAGGEMLFGRHVLSAQFVAKDCPATTKKVWRVSANNRIAADGPQREERDFDALVLSDKLLVLPNQYAVLSNEDVGALALPSLASEACVVLLVALDKAAISSHGLSARGVADVLEATDKGNRESSADNAVRLIVHESNKPQRDLVPDSYDLWTLHSGRQYAARNLRPEVDGEAPGLMDEEAVKAEMLAEFFRILEHSGACATGQAPPLKDSLVFSSLMAWDHAKPLAPDSVLAATHLIDTERRAGVCGDFFGGCGATGVEAAALRYASPPAAEPCVSAGWDLWFWGQSFQEPPRHTALLYVKPPRAKRLKTPVSKPCCM
jgi:hypothetical protein